MLLNRSMGLAGDSRSTCSCHSRRGRPGSSKELSPGIETRGYNPFKALFGGCLPGLCGSSKKRLVEEGQTGGPFFGYDFNSNPVDLRGMAEAGRSSYSTNFGGINLVGGTDNRFKVLKEAEADGTRRL